MAAQYDVDFVAWSEETARAIEDGRWDEIDRAALADEVASLARSDKRALRSCLIVLYVHMLKLRYQPERHTRSWDLSISHAQNEIAQLIEESPSLRPLVPAFLADSYAKARGEAAIETGLPIETFPASSSEFEQEVQQRLGL